MKFNKVLIITKKEIAAVFDNPSSYIILIAFNVLWQFMFFRSIFLIGEVSLRTLFDFLPWMFLILVPAITMSLISKEKDNGTLELVLTHPVTEMELIAGKFLGAFLFILFALLFSVPVAFAFSLFGQLDWGIYFAQFLGSMLFGSAFISLGVYVSSLFKNVFASLLITVGAGFILIISGSEFFTMNFPYQVALLLERISLLSHLSSISRGVIDLRDVWYFLTFSFLFLFLTYLQFLKSKYGVNRKKYLSYQTAALLIVGIVLLTNFIGNSIPGRLDLTREKAFTLSESTKKVIGDLDDIVKITFYRSEQLPAQYTPVTREIQDLLKDYQAGSKGNISIEIKNPSKDKEIELEAQQLGVQQIQFNVIGQEEFQVKTGFIGLVIGYAGNNEVIPFVNNINDLEYEITTLVRKLTQKVKPTLGFLSGHGEKSLETELGIFGVELRKQFNILRVEPKEDTKELDANFDVLVIAGPTLDIPIETSQSITQAIDNGKDVMVLLDNIIVNMTTGDVATNSGALNNLLSNYGVKAGINIIYDLQANNTIRADNGQFSVFVPYPLWIKALAADNNFPINKKIQAIDLPWASTLEIDYTQAEKAGYKVIPLLKTSPYAGIKVGQLTIDPNQQFENKELSERIVAVALEPLKDKPSSSKGKLIVVSDSDFLTEQFTQGSAQNLAFGVNSLSWLSDSESLADIKVKNRIAPSLLFENKMQPLYVKYGNLGLAVLIPTMIGLFRVVKRRNLRSRSYEF